MWRKSEDPPAPVAAQTPSSPAKRSEPSRDVATIGPSIAIKGDLTGNEDLVIQGRLKGEVKLKQNNVTVGKSGRVEADIYGRSIRVEGDVNGNLYGEQEVVIRASGRVQGNIVSPRVTLENGSNFKGSIDMEAEAKQPAIAKKPERPVGTGGGEPRKTETPAGGVGGPSPQKSLVGSDQTPAKQ